jgi:hypothetical protein
MYLSQTCCWVSSPEDRMIQGSVALPFGSNAGEHLICRRACHPRRLSVVRPPVIARSSRLSRLPSSTVWISTACGLRCCRLRSLKASRGLGLGSWRALLLLLLLCLFLLLLLPTSKSKSKSRSWDGVLEGALVVVVFICVAFVPPPPHSGPPTAPSLVCNNWCVTR